MKLYGDKMAKRLFLLFVSDAVGRSLFTILTYYHLAADLYVEVLLSPWLNLFRFLFHSFRFFSRSEIIVLCRDMHQFAHACG